ncbi:MAG: hypothetical protein RMJ51_02510 [Candidatus Calescibacterium sp.]|nr:hypothetical protein [Candidatus Calescibacterium sp.]MCX7972297.1 hypothetical protein [bacterium]MDW8195099.1 hypothetical protein [Candidatus Calescibacterium sp.]
MALPIIAAAGAGMLAGYALSQYGNNNYYGNNNIVVRGNNNNVNVYNNVNININLGAFPVGLHGQIPPHIIIQLILILIQLLQAQQCGCGYPPIFGPVGGVGLPGTSIGMPPVDVVPFWGNGPFIDPQMLPLIPFHGTTLPPFPRPPSAIDYGMAIGGAVGGTVGGIAGGIVGWQAGGAIGAALGTAILPGVGTLIGGLLGSFIGAIGGSAIGQGVGRFVGGLVGGVVGAFVEAGKSIFNGVKRLLGFG